MAIQESTIDEVRTRCDIVDVIGSYVQLRRSGSGSFVGLCPFHQEKTPSFHVNSQRQSFHCFGCGKGGNVFSFIMEKENLSFPDAVRLLASRAGVVIQEEYDGSMAEAKARNREKERLWAINELLCNYFCDNLRNYPDSPAALYLKKRGIPDEVAKEFRIGAALPGWDNCINLCRRQGFSDNELLAAGVACRSERSGRIFDQFRERLVFSIADENGRVAGFSARTLVPKPEDGRKYVNTPDTPVFHKGRLLYALDRAKRAMGEKGMAILCEGQLDTIAFHRAGFTCAAAPQGTAFTLDQAKIVRRYTNHIYLAFDADGAGQKAIMRAIEILLPLSVDIKVIRIPGGKDPDELFASGGAMAVANAVDGAVSWLQVVLDSLPQKFQLNTAVGRGEAAAMVAGFLNLVSNQVEQEVYVRDAAKILEVSESAILSEMTRGRKQAYRREEFKEKRKEYELAKQREEHAPASLITILEWALKHEKAAMLAAESLKPEELSGDDPVILALNCVINSFLTGEYAKIPERLGQLLVTSPSVAVSRLLVDESKLDYPEEHIERAVLESVADFRHHKMLKKRRLLQDKLKSTADLDEKLKILAQIKRLDDGEIELETEAPVISDESQEF